MILLLVNTSVLEDGDLNVLAALNEMFVAMCYLIVLSLQVKAFDIPTSAEVAQVISYLALVLTFIDVIYM